MKQLRNKRIGTKFEDFLKAEGIFEEVDARAVNLEKAVKSPLAI